jgi:hypothetical protein
VPVCNVTKFRVLPCVLFMLPDPSSLRGGVEGCNEPRSSSSADSDA